MIFLQSKTKFTISYFLHFVQQFLSRPQTNNTYFKMPETEPVVVAEGDVVDAPKVDKVVAEAPAETTEAAPAQTEANGTAEVVADGE